MLGGGGSRCCAFSSTNRKASLHADCELSGITGTILDVEDVIPGGKYTLEVSSPGLGDSSRGREFERFVGHKVKVVLRQPVENQRTWVGALRNFAEGIITLEPSPGKVSSFRWNWWRGQS
jgi:ribosome maturation factor RimP